MSSENEIIDKTEAKSSNKSQKKAKTSSKSTKNTKGFTGLSERFQQKKFKNTLAVILILFAVYGFLACISYIFTWKEDQDIVLSQSFVDYFFSGNEVPVGNWLGKFGAWISHLFMYRWFGFTSLAICLLSFLLGVRILLKINLLPFKKTMAISLVFMIWGSIFLGYFASIPSFSGGSFGFYINNWLTLTIGKFGAFLFVLALLYVVVLLLFNPDFGKLLSSVMAWGKEGVDSETEQEEDAVNSIADIKVVNTIKDDQIKEDQKSDAISFDEEEDELAEAELDNEMEDDFEITLAKEEDPKPTSKNDELEVEIPKNDEELSESELNDLQKEFGDYDPTLDLSSYILPPVELLRDFGPSNISINKQELEDNKNKIVETLSHYKIDIAKIKATVGPTVTLYEIVPAPGVRISKIKNLEDDIALSLSALGIRIIAPIPGKGTIGIEVPNSTPEMVSMRSLIASEKFQNSDMELPVVMGKTITNETYMFDLTKLPHLLVAGATGQGKSVGLNAILISILYKKHPAQVKFVLVDPKKVELTLFNRIERHFLAKLPGEEEAIITDTSKVVN
ncbi:MAG: DNA translocase FtsK 4TM domain-containing protein, partial [Bacteroidetes bacterium]|nr:DNA translocase FtsK 4TM domain-containing protein [Bacteroidota bacterium]